MEDTLPKFRAVLCVCVMVMAALACTSYAQETTGKIPKGIVDSLATLDKDFQGLAGYGEMQPNHMPTEIAKREKQIAGLESLCLADKGAFTTIPAYLQQHLDSFSTKYAPGKILPKDILEKSAFEWGEAPGDGCTTRAIILLHLAKKSKSTQLTSSAISSICRVVNALSNWSEQVALHQYPDAAKDVQEERLVIGGSMTTHGAELAWLCEQFMIDCSAKDDMPMPDAAKSVLKEYVQWRSGIMAGMNTTTCLPADFQFKTITYAQCFAIQLTPIQTCK